MGADHEAAMTATALALLLSHGPYLDAGGVAIQNGYLGAQLAGYAVHADIGEVRGVEALAFIGTDLGPIRAEIGGGMVRLNQEFPPGANRAWNWSAHLRFGYDLGPCSVWLEGMHWSNGSAWEGRGTDSNPGWNAASVGLRVPLN
jgi:hypothetical protein